MTIFFILSLRLRFDKPQSSHLILVTTKLELTNFSHEIPNDNVGVLGATGKPNPGFVKSEERNGRFVSIEADKHGRDFAVPESDAAILVANSEDVFIYLALGDRCDRNFASLVPPPAQ